MKGRCRIKTHSTYEYYGGQGIDYCKEWESFDVFKAWADSAGYAIGLSLDRLNTSLGYFPGNCRWIPRARQSENKRKAGTVLPRKRKTL